MTTQNQNKLDIAIIVILITITVMLGCFIAYGDIFRQWLITFSTISLIFIGAVLILMICNLSIFTMTRFFGSALDIWKLWVTFTRMYIDNDFRRAEVLELYAKTRLIDAEAVAKRTIVMGLSGSKGALIVNDGNPTYIPPVPQQKQLIAPPSTVILRHDEWFPKALSANHLILVGEGGAGKSTTARAFINHKKGRVIAIDPHGRRKDWVCEIVGAGRNFEEIDDYFKIVISEMTHRYNLYEQGVEDFEPLTVVVDEVTTLAKKCKNWESFFTELATEARKVNITLIILVHGKSVKTLKLEGQGDLRLNFTFIYLGKHAVAQMIESASMERPAVMEIDNVIQMIDTSNIPSLKQDERLDNHLDDLLSSLPNDREKIIAQLLLQGVSDAAIAKHLSGKFYKNKMEVLDVRSVLNGNLAK